MHSLSEAGPDWVNFDLTNSNICRSEEPSSQFRHSKSSLPFGKQRQDLAHRRTAQVDTHMTSSRLASPCEDTGMEKRKAVANGEIIFSFVSTLKNLENY